MQYHDPQMQNLEGTLTHDATPRRDEDEETGRESSSFVTGMRDLCSDPSGGPRKYYEF